MENKYPCLIISLEEVDRFVIGCDELDYLLNLTFRNCASIPSVDDHPSRKSLGYLRDVFDEDIIL
jgi:hypothetical protein